MADLIVMLVGFFLLFDLSKGLLRGEVASR
jgi:hypothetical protein